MSDDGLAAVVAAFGIGVVFALLVCVLGYLLVTFQARRDRCRGGESACGTNKAWDDPEQGECGKSAGAEGDKVNGASPLTPRQLRGLLEDEIGKGIRKAGLAERLDRLEREVCTREESKEDLRIETKEGANTKLRSCAMTRTPNSSDRSGGSSAPTTEDLAPLPGAIFGLPLSPPPMQVPVPGGDPPGAVPAKSLAPTDRQLAAVEPPENNRPRGLTDKESALQASLVTVQKALGSRDAQTTELHRQLREARQSLWLQTSQAGEAKEKLHALLADPSRAPQAQAEALRDLSAEVKSLAARLAEAQEQEKQWSDIAKRQRAFFFQSEHMGQEGLSLVRKHPAGEIFLVPPPVILEEDDANPPGSRWDVGTSHCNPYKVDSWPFEPNVLAARASREPDLNRWDEGLDDEEEDEEMDADEGSDEVHIPNADDDDDLSASGHEEDAEQSGASNMGRLPPLPAGFGGSETARSL